MVESKLLQQVNIFISSPSDLGDERRAVAEVIYELNQDPFVKDRYLFVPLAYEHEVPPKTGDEAQMIVDRYMRAATDCYMVVCMFWNRMGTPFTNPLNGKPYGSGTHYEFMTAYTSSRANGKPQVLLYRKTQTESDGKRIDPQQQHMVNQFFSKFEGSNNSLKGLYQRFDTTDQFKTLFAKHLKQIVVNHPPENDGQMIRREQVRAYQEALDVQVWDDILGELGRIKKGLDEMSQREATRARISALEANKQRLAEQRDEALIRLRDARDEARMMGDIQRSQQTNSRSLWGLAALAAAAAIGLAVSSLTHVVFGVVIGVVTCLVLLISLNRLGAKPASQPQLIAQLEAELRQVNAQIAAQQKEIDALNNSLQSSR